MSRHTTASSHQPRTIHAGTLGPLGAYTRRALSFDPGAGSNAYAALVLLGTATKTPAANVPCRHLFVDRELPLLILAGASADVGYYFVVNLFDRTARAAFELAVAGGGMEVLMSGPHGGTCAFNVTLSVSEHEKVRADLRKFQRAQLDDSNAWFLRMFLVANELPNTIGSLDEAFGNLCRHEVIYLNGQQDLHGTAVQIAIERASAKR